MSQDLEQQWRWCAGRDPVAPEHRIGACTAVIEARQFSGAELAVAFYWRGTSFLALRRFEDAIGDYDEAIRLKPDYARAYMRRGLAHLRIGWYEHAAKDYDQALGLGIDDPEIAYHERGIAHYQMRKYERAIQDYDQVIGLAPRHVDAFYHRGLANLGIGHYKRSIEDFDEVLRLDSDVKIALYMRGIAHANAGEYDHAIRSFDEALRADPKWAAVLYARGLAHRFRGDSALATADIAKAKEIEPNIEDDIERGDVPRVERYEDTWDMCANMALRVPHEVLISACTIVVNSGRETGARLAIALNNRGAAYSMSGEHERAIRDFDEVIRLKPDAGAYYNRGLVHNAKGDYDRAIQDYDDAIRLKYPLLDAVLLARGTAYYRQGFYAGALADCDAVLDRSPNSAAVRYLRGLSYRKVGQVTRGEDDIAAAKRISPTIADEYEREGIR